jgi:hypothetical protein
MTERVDLLRRAYNAFNTRDVDAVLALMHADVDWPNGMEGGRVHGHAGVRDYWTRQWAMINPHVHPVQFHVDDSSITVDVHQVIYDRSGQLLMDTLVQHVYQFEDGLIRSMDIRKPDTRHFPGVRRVS